jgi:hypothetical protein
VEHRTPQSRTWRIVVGIIVSIGLVPAIVVVPYIVRRFFWPEEGDLEITKTAAEYLQLVRDVTMTLTTLIGVICGPLNLILAWRADRRNAREMELKIRKLEQELRAPEDEKRIIP